MGILVIGVPALEKKTVTTMPTALNLTIIPIALANYYLFTVHNDAKCRQNYIIIILSNLSFACSQTAYPKMFSFLSLATSYTATYR